jgi:ADP-heptose:LPS heptosyltransferase
VLGIQSLSLQLAKHSGATWQLGYSYNHRGDNLNRALLPHHSCHRSGWEYSPQSAPHIVDFWTEMFRRAGIAIEPGAWQLNLPDVSQPVGDMFGREYRGPKIGLHPFSGNPIRNWLLGRFAILGRQLQYTWGAHLVITGGAVDSRSARWLAKTIGGHCTVTAGKIGLIDTWSALRELDLVISVDTGMIHMAAALDIPVVSLFGPGDPAIWGPHRQLNRVIQCFPNCQRCKGGHCVQPRIYCMEAISVDHVLDKVQEILRKEPVVSTVGT